MSYAWTFYTFDADKLDALLGSGDANAEAAVVDAATWDTWDGQGAPSIENLAKRLVYAAELYAGLGRQEAESLDGIVVGLFSPEGLADQLGVTPLSPDGLSPAVVEELLGHGSPEAGSDTLSLLSSGRRLGSSDAERCTYCLLSPTEVELMSVQSEAAFGSATRWSADWVPGVLEECLLAVLREAKTEARSVVAVLG